MRKLNVVSFGVGVIGSLVARHIVEKKSDKLNLAGAYDIDPSKVGKDLGVTIGLGKPMGVNISNNLDEVLSGEVDVAIHTTTSRFEGAYPQIASIVERGVDVVSSCEELSYPYSANRKLADELDSLAKSHDATVLGTGINPGFVMDVLPITLTAPCEDVRKIRVWRRMNAATRRVPFQKKVGVGMSSGEFEDAVVKGSISGHVGLEQSLRMIGDALGWGLDRVEIGKVEPVMARSALKEGYVRVSPGQVAGVSQTAKGFVRGTSKIELNFSAYVGSEEEYDMVEVDGVPSFKCKVTPCVHGDTGTVAMLTNMVPIVADSPPGLHTMKDIRVPSAFL